MEQMQPYFYCVATCHVSKLRATWKSNRFPYSNRTLGYNRMDHPISKKRPCVVTSPTNQPNWKLASWTLEEASDFSHPKTVPWHFCNSVLRYCLSASSTSLGKMLYEHSEHDWKFHHPKMQTLLKYEHKWIVQFSGKAPSYNKHLLRNKHQATSYQCLLSGGGFAWNIIVFLETTRFAKGRGWRSVDCWVRCCPFILKSL